MDFCEENFNQLLGLPRKLDNGVWCRVTNEDGQVTYTRLHLADKFIYGFEEGGMSVLRGENEVEFLKNGITVFVGKLMVTDEEWCITQFRTHNKRGVQSPGYTYCQASLDSRKHR